jgi:hypothetical protein
MIQPFRLQLHISCASKTHPFLLEGILFYFEVVLLFSEDGLGPEDGLGCYYHRPLVYLRIFSFLDFVALLSQTLAT